MIQTAAKTSSSRTSAPPEPKRYSRRGHSAEEIEQSEFSRSRKSAILQLTMGRLAHTIGIAAGLALAATAVLAYLQENWDWLSSAPEWTISLNWVVPLIAGVVVSAIALYAKWEPYFADRGEPHFIMSIVAVAVPAFFIALIVLDETGYYALGRPSWLYPASLLGISLTLASLAMTWDGNSNRKTISIASAAFPSVLLIFPVIFRFTDVELASILPMAYLGSAVAFQLSGSMLHIIASSTNVQEREVLRASDGKLKELVRETEKRRQAIEYHEDALRSKQADLEAYEKRLMEEFTSAEEIKKQVAAMQTELEGRVELARSSRQELTKTEVGVESKLETLKLRQAELDLQARDLEKRAKTVSTKEEKVAARELDANKLTLDAQAKDREIRNRLADIEADRKALESRTRELKSLETSIAEREKQVRMRESTLEMRSVAVLSAKEQLGKVSAEKTAVKTLEQELMMRKEAVDEREAAIRAREEQMKRDSEKAERLIARSDKQMNELVDKETMLLAKQKAFTENEARLRAAAESVNAQIDELERLKASLADKESQYKGLTDTVRDRIASLSSKEDEAGRRMAALDRREDAVKELDRRLKTEQERMNSKLKDLLEKEKDLQAKEESLGLKHAELKVLEREVLDSVEDVEVARGMPSDGSDERSKTLEVREQRLREKEQELKSRHYQREKELERREQTLKDHLRKDIEHMEEKVEQEYAEEKVKAGIERLDDLMLGGMPFASNVLYVGPPFIGKEVAMMLFLAEGLKKGVPVVIVTTSRPPVEIERDMAPMMPTFLEYEQLGLVRWIDASGAADQQGTPASSPEHIAKVTGPDDYDGVLRSMDSFIKDFQKQEHPYFRVAYMSLSMSVTQAEDKQSFQFVQGLAGRIRQARGVAVYAIERGMHTEQQLESIQHQMTGAVMFKTDKQKTMLSVQGVTDAQTRDWVEYRHTNKAIMMGAFSLERIR